MRQRGNIFGFGCAVATALACVIPAQAQTTINFDDLTFANYDPLAEGYQSRVGSTANVTVDFRTLNATTLAPTLETVSLWNSGYSELSKVAFARANGEVFEMTLAADPGYTVSLLDFRLGAYQGDQANAFVTITDSSLGTLFSQGPTTIPFNPSALYSVNATSSNGGTLTLRYGTNWDVGIDNIRFSQTVVGAQNSAPEPGSMALTLIGMTPIIGVAVRRRKQS